MMILMVKINYDGIYLNVEIYILEFRAINT